MHRKRGYLRMIFKNMSRPIALMYIQVNDKYSLCFTLVQQPGCGHSLIVHKAETFSKIKTCTIRTSSLIERNTVLHGILRRLYRAIQDIPLPNDELLR